jgi:heme/copper-type cytochrome/quinol oxidase subunit 2
VLFWVVVVALGILEALIVVTALRMRTTRSVQRGIVGSRPMEVLWTLLPVLLLAAMVYLSFQTYQDNVDTAPDDSASTTYDYARMDGSNAA